MGVDEEQLMRSSDGEWTDQSEDVAGDICYM